MTGDLETTEPVAEDEDTDEASKSDAEPTVTEPESDDDEEDDA